MCVLIMKFRVSWQRIPRHTDIDFVKKRSTDELLNSNQEMVTDLQTIITDFTDFEKYVLQALASSNKEDKYNDQIQSTCIILSTIYRM